MSAGQQYRIEYAEEAIEHLRALTARQRTIVQDGVNAHLQFEPTVETRNRKRMRPNVLAPWELRLRVLRVFYDVQEQPDPVVFIVAVGVKEGNKVRIAGQLFDYDSR